MSQNNCTCVHEFSMWNNDKHLVNFYPIDSFLNCYKHKHDICKCCIIDVWKLLKLLAVKYFKVTCQLSKTAYLKNKIMVLNNSFDTNILFMTQLLCKTINTKIGGVILFQGFKLKHSPTCPLWVWVRVIK